MSDATLDLYTIGFGRPDLLCEQKRLLDKYMEDSFVLHMIDNTPSESYMPMRDMCDKLGVEYKHADSDPNNHAGALNFAAAVAAGREYIMFLDHDVFPRRPASVIYTLDEVGFFGVGQFHSPTKSHYLWPGLCAFSRSWLAGRRLNFNGIRGIDKREDGDTGSMNASLFTHEEWQKLWGMEHGYQAIREPDSVGLQSWGVEILGDWIHLTNSSNWLRVPNPEERNRLALELVRAL